MKKIIYRQGDVLIERISKVNAAVAAQPITERIILAHGEATGHHHAIEDRDAADWWKVSEDEQYLDVKTPCEVTHQEHAAIPLSPGKYKVTRQREYSPEAIRRVAD